MMSSNLPTITSLILDCGIPVFRVSYWIILAALFHTRCWGQPRPIPQVDSQLPTWRAPQNSETKKENSFWKMCSSTPNNKNEQDTSVIYIYNYILYCSSPEVLEKAMEERNNQQPLEVSHHFNFSAFQLRSLCLQTASPSARAELFEIFLQRCRGGKCCGWDAMKISISPRKRGEIHGNSQMVGKQLVVSTIDGGNDEE